MSSNLSGLAYEDSNPLDVIEMVFSRQELTFDRVSDGEMKAVIEGKWCDYRVYFEWHGRHNALECTFWPTSLYFTETDYKEIAEFVTRVNEELWLGHFTYSQESQTVLFKHTFLLGQAGTIYPEQIQDIFELAKLAFDRFYPFFRVLANGQKNLSDTINVALMDVAGEA
jgi:hypothetical protein